MEVAPTLCPSRCGSLHARRAALLTVARKRCDTLIAGLQVFQQYGQSGYAASPTQYKSQNYGPSGSGQGWYEASTHAQPTFILK